MELDSKERRETVRLLKKGGYQIPKKLREALGVVKLTGKDKRRMELFLTEHRLMVVAIGKTEGRERGFRLYTWEGYKKMKEMKNGKGEGEGERDSTRGDPEFDR